MYSEVLPANSLQSSVECFWQIKPSSVQAESTSLILPDGCADLIFDLTPGNESAYWVGTMTKSLIVPQNGTSHMLGIRFQPGVARSLLQTPLAELTDLRVDFSDITPHLDRLVEQVIKNKSDANLILNSWLKSQLREDQATKLVRRAFQLAKEQTTQLRVSIVCESLGVSRQYLNRIFRDRVGIDFKTFHRILRMRALINGIQSGVEQNWSDVAAEYGFYDQSHMIHDFNEIVGFTPKDFIG